MCAEIGLWCTINPDITDTGGTDIQNAGSLPFRGMSFLL